MAEKDILEIALAFAEERHKGQFRNDGVTPYDNHPKDVEARLRSFGVYSRPVRSGGLLHDTVEDTNTTLKEITAVFGQEVADLVAAVSYKGDRAGKQAHIDSFGAAPFPVQVLKAADRLCNVKDFLDDGSPDYALKYLHKADRLFDSLAANTDRDVAVEITKQKNELEALIKSKLQ